MKRQPLADRMRPTDIDGIVGQKHLFGKNGAIRRMIEQDHITNMIFFGPPGTGKTTSARIIAARAGMDLHELNATSATLSDVRDVISRSSSVFGSAGTLLYLDEIQYFNRKQQQSLLEFLENGQITMIASTTENPYMYVYTSIISRSAVFEFKAVSAEDIVPAVRRGLDILNEESGSTRTATGEALLYIASAGAGDVRRSINYLENAYYALGPELTEITVDSLSGFVPKTVGNFDKNGTVHYDLLSALQKSIRGSDPDAAIFYLAKILNGGDLIGACRRLQVIASEDIGLAYPMAPAIVRACVESAFDLGLPEASIPLSHAAIMLATAPKSNSSHVAYAAAMSDVEAGKGQTIPYYMRPSEKYKDYKYPHDYPNRYVRQQYLPDDVKDKKYYEYAENKAEQAAKEYWKKIKGE